MTVEFTVSGATKQALEARAQTWLDTFAQGKEPKSIHIDARPLIHRWGEPEPELWEGEVTAEI